MLETAWRQKLDRLLSRQVCANRELLRGRPVGSVYEAVISKRVSERADTLRFSCHALDSKKGARREYFQGIFPASLHLSRAFKLAFSFRFLSTTFGPHFFNNLPLVMVSCQAGCVRWLWTDPPCDVPYSARMTASASLRLSHM